MEGKYLRGRGGAPQNLRKKHTKALKPINVHKLFASIASTC